jgi:hypothetical protein
MKEGLDVHVVFDTQYGLEGLGESQMVFNDDQWIQAVRYSDRLGSVAWAATGLQLLWGKLHTKHGDWYRQLQKIPMNPNKAQKLMEAAKELMKWLGIEFNMGNKAHAKAILSRVATSIVSNASLMKDFTYDPWRNKKSIKAERDFRVEFHKAFLVYKAGAVESTLSEEDVKEMSDEFDLIVKEGREFLASLAKSVHEESLRRQPLPHFGLTLEDFQLEAEEKLLQEALCTSSSGKSEVWVIQGS